MSDYYDADELAERHAHVMALYREHVEIAAGLDRITEPAELLSALARMLELEAAYTRFEATSWGYSTIADALARTARRLREGEERIAQLQYRRPIDP